MAGNSPKSENVSFHRRNCRFSHFAIRQKKNFLCYYCGCKGDEEDENKIDDFTVQCSSIIKMTQTHSKEKTFVWLEGLCEGKVSEKILMILLLSFLPFSSLWCLSFVFSKDVISASRSNFLSALRDFVTFTQKHSSNDFTLHWQSLEFSEEITNHKYLHIISHLANASPAIRELTFVHEIRSSRSAIKIKWLRKKLREKLRRYRWQKRWPRHSMLPVAATLFSSLRPKVFIIKIWNRFGCC